MRDVLLLPPEADDSPLPSLAALAHETVLLMLAGRHRPTPTELRDLLLLAMRYPSLAALVRQYDAGHSTTNVERSAP